MSEEHIEEGEEMDATNDDDAAMMAMMGLGGFGTTKVYGCANYYNVENYICLSLGKTCRRQPGRGCLSEKDQNLAAIYEQVRLVWLTLRR